MSSNIEIAQQIGMASTLYSCAQLLHPLPTDGNLRPLNEGATSKWELMH